MLVLAVLVAVGWLFSLLSVMQALLDTVASVLVGGTVGVGGLVVLIVTEIFLRCVRSRRRDLIGGHRPPTTQQRSVLITGASSGIGAELALQLAAKEEEGIKLVLVARRQAALEQVSAKCAAHGATVVVRTADVTDARAMREVVLRSDDDASIGPLDCVVANAGSHPLGLVGVGARRRRQSFGAELLEADATVTNVNVVGVLNTIRPAIECFLYRRDGQQPRRQGKRRRRRRRTTTTRGAGASRQTTASGGQPARGHIVLVSSVAGRFPGYDPAWASYNASKAWVSSYGAGLQAALSSQGVRVTVIEPGFVRSEMQEALSAAGTPACGTTLSTAAATRRIVAAIGRGESGTCAFPWYTACGASMLGALPLPLAQWLFAADSEDGSAGVDGDDAGYEAVDGGDEEEGGEGEFDYDDDDYTGRSCNNINQDREGGTEEKDRLTAITASASPSPSAVAALEL